MRSTVPKNLKLQCRRAGPVAMAVMALLAAACGDGSESDGGSEGDRAVTTATPGDSAQVTVEWATEVVEAYAILEDNLVANTEQFSDTAFGGVDVGPISPAAEVEAYAGLTRNNADTISAGTEHMPGAPPDDELSALYAELLAALAAEADGSAALAVEMADDLDVLKDDAVSTASVPGPADSRYDDIRRTVSELRDATATACFDLQAAMTDQDLPLLDCTMGD